MRRGQSSLWVIHLIADGKALNSIQACGSNNLSLKINVESDGSSDCLKRTVTMA